MAQLVTGVRCDCNACDSGIGPAMVERAAMISPLLLLATAADPTAAAFATLAALAGEWRPADAPEARLRVRFATTAGGTVVVEEWLRDGRPHSMTLYHRDGATLVATHYCPQGNQPRLVARAGLDFAFRDATDLDEGESYLRTLGLRVSGDGTLVRREAYRTGTTDQVEELRLVRVR